MIAKSLSSVCGLFYRARYGNRVSWGRNVILNHRFRFKGPGKLIIGDNCNLWAHQEPNSFHTYSKNAVIKVGNKCRLNGVSVHCRKSVIIGDDCLAGSAIIMDNDFHSTDYTNRNDPGRIGIKSVVIEDRAWLAGQSVILKGVTIGKEAVVAFRAVVTKDIPAASICAGNPAIVVKRH